MELNIKVLEKRKIWKCEREQCEHSGFSSYDKMVKGRKRICTRSTTAKGWVRDRNLEDAVVVVDSEVRTFTEQT